MSRTGTQGVDRRIDKCGHRTGEQNYFNLECVLRRGVGDTYLGERNAWSCGSSWNSRSHQAKKGYQIKPEGRHENDRESEKRTEKETDR